jgi:energy-coupling factor transporter ATP-binding protein EcfA2
MKNEKEFDIMHNDQGNILDANCMFSVLFNNNISTIECTLESSGGASTKGSRKRRNPDYDQAFELILTRVKSFNGKLTKAILNSKRAIDRSEHNEDQRIVSFLWDDRDIKSIDLINVGSVNKLRCAVARGMSKMYSDAKKQIGNAQKRVTLCFEIPGEVTKLQLMQFGTDNCYQKLIVKFKTHFPDFKTFSDSGESYRNGEDLYKREASKIMHDKFDKWISSGLGAKSEEEVSNGVFELISKTDLIDWRARDAFYKNSSGTSQFKDFLFSLLNKVNDNKDIKDDFNAFCDWIKKQGHSATISKLIPTYLLYLWDPNNFIFIKSDIFDRFLKAIDENPLGRGKYLNYSEYERILKIIAKVKAELSPLHPRDMIDIHSFYYVVMEYDKAKTGGETELITTQDYFNIKNLFEALRVSKLKLEESVITRFTTSLQTKPFVLLTGLSGSGKTLLAQAFSKWITPKNETIKLKDKEIVKGQITDDGFFWQVEAYHLTRDRIILKKSYSDILIEIPEYRNPEDIKIIIDGEEDVCRLRKTSNGAPHIYSLKKVKDWLAKIGVGNFFKVKILPSDGKLNNILAFEQIAQPEKHLTPGYCLLSVGANWTSKEDILGYPDALDSESYIVKPALRLLLEAGKEENKDRPFFLILDEMNLSHVERYFADFLSAMESNEVIELHEGPEEYRNAESDLRIPQRIENLPPNFFIIGTVNVDETTYMFSPKVLDRANVIEFRAESDQILGFLDNPSEVDLDDIAGKGVDFAQDFVAKAKMKMGEGKDFCLDEATVKELKPEFEQLFAILAKHEAEFGFRTAKEISRFVYFHKLLTNDDANWQLKDAVDAQVMQKILPKMHGSQRKLEPILQALGVFCFRKTEWVEKLEEKAEKASELNDDQLNMIGKDSDDKPLYNWKDAHYPISFRKIQRMLKKLERDGFASFAEA